jgi:hypothetical protein
MATTRRERSRFMGGSWPTGDMNRRRVYSRWAEWKICGRSAGGKP